MKTNKDTLQSAMDRRLSFLDDLPSCRASVQHRIAQEEESVMKKKMSVGLVFAIVLVLLSVAALAATLLISPRVTAVQAADRALEEQFGITTEMQTFFGREHEELPDGTVKVTYEGVGTLKYPLGTYIAIVKDGKAEITWSHSGEEISGGYDSEVWGIGQIRQMMEDSLDPARKKAYLERSEEIASAHGAVESDESSEAAEGLYEQREAEKTAALRARRLTEEEMIAAARDFIITSYGLNGEQQERLDLYTNSFEAEENSWYEMVNGQPCFEVEYLLYQPVTVEQVADEEPLGHGDMDGYYKVYVNVETGVIEEYEYNSALAGEG